MVGVLAQQLSSCSSLFLWSSACQLYERIGYYLGVCDTLALDLHKRRPHVKTPPEKSSE